MILETICGAVLIKCFSEIYKITKNTNHKNNKVSTNKHISPILKKQTSNMFDGNRIKDEKYCAEKILKLGFLNSTIEVEKFLIFLKIHWKDYLLTLWKMDNEKMEQKLYHLIEWWKVSTKQNINTICLFCYFRSEIKCCAYTDNELPILKNQLCEYFRTFLLYGEAVNGHQEVVSINGDTLGRLPLKRGDMITPDGRWLKSDEVLDKNGNIRKKNKGETRLATGYAYTKVYINHCWHCHNEISSNYCELDMDDKGKRHGYICNKCGYSLRGSCK